MIVEIFFVRHGESKANVAQHQTSCGTIKHLLMRDPTLTEEGVFNSQACAEDMPKVDIVLCSELLRAIQTALAMCPERFVHVVPYLNELGTGLDNLPHDLETQQKILGADSHRVLYEEGKAEDNFMKYIVKHIVPRFKGKTNIKIALFTHSRLMRKHLKMPLNELPNNCTVSKKYYFV